MPASPTALPLRRRTALLGMGAALSLGSVNAAHAGTPNAARLVVVNIKGGLDGLAAVPPYASGYLPGLRAALMAPHPETDGGMLDLNGFFGMHPGLPNLHAMYKAGEALVVHAVGNFQAGRSHFQGQDYLQSGQPRLMASGWIDRLANLMPMVPGALPSVVNMGLQIPLLVQGRTQTAGWSQPAFAPLSNDMAGRVASIMAPDALLGPASAASFADGQAMHGIIGSGPAMPAGLPSAAQLAWAAGALLAADEGPRIATLTVAGVDTHANQVVRLDAQMPILDLIFAALKASLGAAWGSTVVMTMTEFGRTAAMNGTGGTDHGTGFAMFVAGGPVAGGKVVARWPGIAPLALYQGRDLLPTVDFRQVAASILFAHLGVSASGLNALFPAGYENIMSGFLR